MQLLEREGKKLDFQIAKRWSRRFANSQSEFDGNGGRYRVILVNEWSKAKPFWKGKREFALGM